MKCYRLISFSLILCILFPFISDADQLEDAITAIKSKDFEKAHELLQPLAEEGNAAAQTRLGALYVNGQGVEKDFDKGLSWIMKAATQGNETAKRIAFKLHLDLVNQGDTTVMYNLGYMCLNDWGGEHDTNVCLGWLENAGKIGHEKSSKLLAKIYSEGLYGIPPDEEKATYWKDLVAGFAAGIDGKWSAEAPGIYGESMKLTFTFKTDGNKLKGAVSGRGPQGSRTGKIRDGKIEGNNFSFVLKESASGMTTTVNYTGTFLGDRLKLTYSIKMSAGRRRGAGIGNVRGGFESPSVSFIAKRIL